MPDLTSAVLVWVLAGLAAVLLGLVIWRWPRLARPGARQVTFRVIALCLIQASMLSLVFVLVNRAGGFYSSWSDLLGRYTSGGTLHILREGKISRSTPVTVIGRAPVTVPGSRQPAGTLQSVLIHGQLSGLTFSGHVYLPPGYPHADRHRQEYPVVVAISESRASTTAPGGASQLAAATAGQITAGRLQPLILVTLPAGPGTDLSCLNVPGGAQSALFFSQDLPAAMASSYQVGTERSGWALLGDSSGGYCALQLALTNASVFSAAAVPAGSYTSPPGSFAWGSSPQLRLQDNLAWLIRHQPMQPISVLFTGTGRAVPFLSVAHRPMVVTAATSSAGPWPGSRVLNWLGHVLSATAGGR